MMSEGKPVIGIIGGTITGNRGAESMLVTTIGRLKDKYPDAHFMIFSYSPKQDRELITRPDIQVLSCKPQALVIKFFPFSALVYLLNIIGINYPGRLLPKAIRCLQKCNLLVDIGGISFADKREIYLPFNILTIMPAFLSGVPVIKLAQAMGPFHNPINRLLSGIFLPKCSKIFARGYITENNLRQIKLVNVERAADIAFSFKNSDSLTDENEDLVEELEHRLVEMRKQNLQIIAISPSSLVYGKSPSYLQKLRDLVLRMDNPDIRFVVYANSNNQSSTKARNNDLYVIRILQDKLKKELPEEVYRRITWAIWNINSHGIRRILNLCDLLITSRFHAMVSGLSLGVPTLVVGWSHKYQETLADFGLDKYSVDFENENIDLSNIAQEMLKNKGAIKTQILKKLPEVQRSSLSQFDIISEYL